MLYIIILVSTTFLWAKCLPEVLYGIMQGWSRDELRVLKGLSLRNTIFFFGLETSLIFIILYAAKGFLFSVALDKWFLVASWQQWLCFALLLTINSALGRPAEVVFWKRWAIYMGGTIYLFPDLAQLSLALLIAITIFTFRKKYIVWSCTIAGLIILGQSVLPYPIMGLMLVSCLITSCGISFLKPVKSLVNNTIQSFVSPKPSLKQYNTLR